ncbi:MAG: caib/baif family protein [Myxococcota bacterium]
MNRTDFLSEFKRLERDFQNESPSFASINSTNLVASAHCMFSNNLENCFRCTHCNNLTDCTGMSHSAGCHACHGCAYMRDCAHCFQCNYLVNSHHCTECNYCFGCFGLSKKDFHILNVKYGRDEYFKITDRLRRELGLL